MNEKKTNFPRLSEDAVRNALAENQSVEFENDRVDYYLHITDSGDIVTDILNADESFIAHVYPESYGFTADQWERGDVSKDDIYDHEIPGDPIFDAIVRELTEKANAWLENNG